MRNRALQEERAPRAPNACAWVAYTASKKRHGLLQAACTSMVKECSQNGVGCHDSYHVYHLRYRLIRMAQMLLACALLHVTQLNMQREVLFQRTRCLSAVLQRAAARAHCPATGYPRHAPYAAPARPQQCRKKKVLEQEIGENGPLGSKARGATTIDPTDLSLRTSIPRN